jgi:hypothetical protein
MPDLTEPQTGRETRLLLLVVGVAVMVLLVLAQWRFPGSDLSVVSPNAAPLAGLAARVTFDEMASTMTDVINRVSPLTVVVPLEPDVPVPATPSAGRGAPAPTQVAPVSERRATLMLALRVQRDVALLHVPAGMTPQRLGDAAVEIVAHDPEREMMLIRVSPSGSEPDTLSASVRTFPRFAYVAALDATPAGPTVQPVFVGRADTVADGRWSHALVPAAVAPGLMAGTLLFSLNGRFVGMVVHAPDGLMVVPAPALETFVQALAAGAGAPE